MSKQKSNKGLYIILLVCGIIIGVVGAVLVMKKKKKKGTEETQPAQTESIIETEAAIYASKVQLVCPKCGKPTRVGHKIYADGKKDRVCKKCGETF